MKLLTFWFALAGLCQAQVIDRAAHPRNWEGTQITSNFNATHTIPALPLWPGGANTIIKDPTYGTRILRATDANTLATYGSYTNYSTFTWSSAEVNAWRKDDKMFSLNPELTGGAILMSFEPSTFQVTPLPTVPNWSCGSSWDQFGGAPAFSFADNNAIYGTGSGCTYQHSFVRYDLASMSGFSQIYDFSLGEPKLASGTFGDISVAGTVIGHERFTVYGCGPEQGWWTCTVIYDQATHQAAEVDFIQGIKVFGASSFTPQTPGAGWNNPVLISSWPTAAGYPAVSPCSATTGGAIAFTCINSGGSNYFINDTGTINCGTGGMNATYKVTGVSGGAVTSLNITAAGSALYTYTPNCSTTATSGNGSGMAMFIPSWVIHNTRVGPEGRYVSISPQYATGCFGIIWDTLTMTTTCMPINLYINGGHKAQGYNQELVSSPLAGDYGPQLLLTHLASPSITAGLLPGSSGPAWIGGVEYPAWQNADPGYDVPAIGFSEEVGGAGATTTAGTYSGWLSATETDRVRQTIWVFADMHAPQDGQGPLPDLYRSSNQSANQVTINAAGSGYAVNDTGTFTCGSGDATYTITSVSGSAVSGFQITSPGAKYSNNTAVCATSATTGSGRGFTINIGSIWNSFYDYPRGSISPDGTYAIFSSPWEGALGSEPGSGGYGEPFRVDVFVAQLKPLTPRLGGTITPASRIALFNTLAPDAQSCTANVYTNSDRSGSPVGSASDTVRDGRTSQIVVTGLAPATHYWSSVVCGGGNGTLLSDFATKPGGTGLYQFPMLFSSAQAVKYCTNAAMTTGCSTLAAAQTQNVPVPSNAAIYVQPAGGSVTVFIAP